MPQLGSQFENTYTVEPGKTAYKTVREKIDLESGVAQVEKRQSEQMGTPFRDYEYVKEEVTTPDKVTDYHVTEYPQGMLFAPETATYRPGDPLYPHEQRLSDIQQLFKIEKVSPESSRAKEIHENIAKTNFSKQELEQTKARITVASGQRHAGSYNPMLNKVNMRAESLDRYHGGQEYDQETFAHELGHAFDSHLRVPFWEKTKHGLSAVGAEKVMEENRGRAVISPTSEGIADGVAERYAVTKKLNFENESRLHPSYPRRTEDLTRSGGYTTRAKYWTNKQEQALYAATRLHVGMHGVNGLGQLPKLNELIDKHLHESGTKWLEEKKQENENRYIREPEYEAPRLGPYDYLKAPTFKNEARALFLGQLLHENPAIHESMHQLGFSGVANHAVDTYKYHEAVHQRKQAQSQLRLWDEPEPKLTPPKKLTREQMRRDDYRPKNSDKKDRLDRMFGGWGR